MTDTKYDLIVKSLQYLARVCDYAEELDGRGFNKLDADFGHSLAEKSALYPLSERQQETALKMLQTYRKQLHNAGIDLPNTDDYKAISRLPRETPPPVTPKPIISSPEPRPVYHGQIGLVDENTLAVSFNYDPTLVQKIKTLPERRWHPDSKSWRVPVSLFAKVREILPQAEVTAKVTQVLEKQNSLAALSNQATSDFEVSGLKGTLMPFQKAGVEFVEKTNGRAMIADEMGLGKTIQALAYLQLHPDLRPAVIVCPAAVKINWKNEADRWLTTGDRFIILNGGKAYDLELSGATVVLINYDILHKWQDKLIAWKPRMLIADEAHYCKNTDSKRSQLTRDLASKVGKVLLLSGTPITNRPKEIWPLLNMIAPTAWPKFWSFAHRYCDPKNNGFGWDFSGASNLDELHERIKPFVVRRRKEQVLKELPDKRRAKVSLEFDQSQKEDYQSAYIGLINLIDNADQTPRGHASSQYLAQIERLKQAAVYAKLPAAIGWIRDFIESGEKLVVFVHHKFVVDTLLSEFGNQAVSLSGDTAPERRDAVVQQFQNDDNIRLFVGNIKAAGIGITLTAASNVAFLEYPWTPGDLSQAEDRTHRIGQKNAVTSWLLMAEDTCDETLVDMLESKRQVADIIHDGKVDNLAISLEEIALKIVGRNGNHRKEL